MKFRGIALVCVVGFFSFASGVTITGRVVDTNTPANPITNIGINLKVFGASTYTDTMGRFSLTFTGTGIKQTAPGKKPVIQLSGSSLSFATAANENVRVDLFDMAGRKIETLMDRAFEAGSHSLPLAALLEKKIGAGLFVVRVQKGAETLTATFMPMGQMVTTEKSPAFSDRFALAKTMASVDSLIVYRRGYVTKALPITGYTTQDMGDIPFSLTAEEISIAHKVDSLLALMSLSQKVGQMVQARKNQLTTQQLGQLGIGSVFNGGSDWEGNNTPSDWSTSIDGYQTAVLNSALKIPMLYGQDCVHGVGTIAGCTVFPHNIGLGCTHDTALVSQIGQIVAKEATGCGIRLNFAPCVASARNERWGRTYEGFGETPEINAIMGAAFTRGLQGNGDMSQSWAVAASVKHYLGDGSTDNGVNAGNTSISEATMRAVHLPQYAASAREGMATVMPSYSSWTRSGTAWKQSVDNFTLTGILKKELGFDGFCVSDWDAISTACGDYGASCVAKSINAGMDMAMIVSSANITTYMNSITSQAGTAIPQIRIDDAVKRILRVKFRMHLWDHPKSDQNLRAQINNSQNRTVARQAVRESLVLLQNTGNVLPLKTSDKVIVVGPWANDLGAQCGGWTISWQGQLGTGPVNVGPIKGETIFTALQTAGGAANVTYSSNGTAITGADKIVCVVGESPYAEGSGDVTVPNFSAVPNYGLIQTCVSSGKPVILVMLTGRPMLLTSPATSCQAIVAAWLPGAEGGGIADVLYGGSYNFTGTLTHTWPATAGQIPINTGTQYSDEQHGSGGAPMFAYGFGLKY
jgi:beta-glucosidase